MANKREAKKESDGKCERLLRVLDGRRTLLIVLQDFPDPDAIAAAAALRELVKSRGEVLTTLACGGFVSRAENRALLKYLGLNVKSLVNIDPASFEAIAVVDTQPGAGNNGLDENVVPDVVVDHHPIRSQTRRSAFFDVRRRYGSTSTILYEYLVSASVAIPLPLATGLLYGIRSDTADFGREAIQADIDAFLALYPTSNKRMLGRISMARVPRAYFQTISKGLRQARWAGEGIYTELGMVESPDIVSEIADLLLRDEETSWAMAIGGYAGQVLISLRTSDVAADAGKVMHKLVGRGGTGGGHCAMAGGQIPWKRETLKALQKITAGVVSRFLTCVGEKPEDVRPLID